MPPVAESTAAVAAGDAKLMKFFGLYQQDDRDIRDERRRQKLEAAYFFMTRVRLPGGVCSPAQWLKLDALARTYGQETLRLTTRQTFQLHRVMKHDLRAVIQGLREVLLDTKAACGDDTRGVTPDDALAMLAAEERSPLTVDEGIALVTHHPEAIAHNHGIQFPGSRAGDRRVTAIWLSKGQRKLGWCWAGNPHGWLGMASCAARWA